MTKSLWRLDIPFKSCSYLKFHGIYWGERSRSISRVLYPFGRLSLISRVRTVYTIHHVAMPFSRFLPSDSREQRSNAGLLGIAAHSVLVSPASLTPFEVASRLVSVAVTKHFCLTAVNRCGALGCPDFPLPMRLKHVCFSFSPQR